MRDKYQDANRPRIANLYEGKYGAYDTALCAAYSTYQRIKRLQ